MPPEETQPVKPDYGFILQTEAPEPAPAIQRVDKKKLFVLIVLLLAAITAAVVIGLTLRSRANEAQKLRLVELAQTQAEIIRTAEIGAEKAERVPNKQRAAAIAASLGGSLQETKNLMSARQAATDDQTLAAKKNKETDDLLTRATYNGSFDRTFTKIIDLKLLAYQRSLLAAYESGSAEEKAALEEAYKDADAMLGLSDQL